MISALYAAGLSGVVCFGAGVWLDHQIMAGRIAEAENQAIKVARMKEFGYGLKQSEIDNALAREKDRIASDRDAAVRELRNTRRERMSEATQAAGQCNGATGAQLSGEDGAFLRGYAADRAREAQTLMACQALLMQALE